ncbi:MAG TPA: ABC transporter substrate-binding protein [Candidatus Angelobacter sp.]|jgi:NitT/TauT family transport system substrate-binding protein|nr:ABC transporter substrate-binding protein [Candidatus Angelobacter sp.]
MPASSTTRRIAAALAVLASAGMLAACGQPAAATQSRADTGPVNLRLGYFPNLTHAIPMVGLDKGFYAKSLGSNVTLTTQTFNAGPAAVEAIFGGALDAAYVGPNPAINAYVKSKGDLVRVIAGAASGGAALVVRPAAGIQTAANLRGKKLATPQLGNTQDVALRSYLAAHGLKTNPQGGGDVSITSTDNATILQLLKQGQLDGAWLPEPWVSRAVAEAGATVFVDEATLWPSGQFPTTELVVTTAFLQAHPTTVRHLVEAHVATAAWIKANPADAQTSVNNALLKLTQKKLDPTVLATAWQKLDFTVDPLATALAKQASAAHDAGLIGSVDLHGIMDLTVLNGVLTSQGKPAVSSGGYGSQ